LAPIETIARRSGDCDDFAILAAALFEYYGIESAIGFFFHPKEGKKGILWLWFTSTISIPTNIMDSMT